MYRKDTQSVWNAPFVIAIPQYIISSHEWSDDENEEAYDLGMKIYGSIHKEQPKENNIFVPFYCIEIHSKFEKRRFVSSGHILCSHWLDQFSQADIK